MPASGATILIVSKNRMEDLRRAVASALAQEGNHEVLVIDDGSTDGTSSMVASEFPKARLVTHAESKGCIVRRNEGAQLSTKEYIVSIDDDAEFTDAEAVNNTLACFDDPQIGAVAIPFRNVNRGPQLLQRSPDEQCWITDTFTGTAFCLKRDIMLKCGGFRSELVHQGEEQDLSIRMLDAGYFVRLGISGCIDHFESPRRDYTRMDFYGCRNAVLFAWQNVPWSFVLPHLIATTVNCALHVRTFPRLTIRLHGILHGWSGMLRAPRDPVSADAYRLFRRLRKRGPVLLADCKQAFEGRPSRLCKGATPILARNS